MGDFRRVIDGSVCSEARRPKFEETLRVLVLGQI